MAINNDYLDYVTGQLSEVGEFEIKKMFGGIGFFKEGKMFAMIGNNVFRLKVNGSNQKDFEKHGMKPYHSNSKKKGMPYWEVPEEILNDKNKLAKWVVKSISISSIK